MTQADDIRLFTVRNYVEPARRRGESTLAVCAGDVHREMGFSNKLPAVVSALGTQKFRDLANVEQIGIDGPLTSSTTTFNFRLR